MTESLQETIAGAVLAEMARRRKKQKDLAGWLGISASQLGQRLACRIDFTVVELDTIAQGLGVPLTQLLPPDRVEATVG